MNKHLKSKLAAVNTVLVLGALVAAMAAPLKWG